MRVLVTGGDGQLGRALGRARPGWTRLGRLALDVAEPGSVRAALARHRPDVVINAAAWTDVDGAESCPERVFAVNAAGPAHLAEACDAHGAALIQVSTDYVFGAGDGPFAPTAPVCPRSVYGRSKAAGEDAARALVRHVVLRTAWVFGPDRPGFPGYVARRARAGAPIAAVGDAWGNPTLADDLAAAVVAVVDASASGDVWGTWHAAGQPATTWHGLAEAVVACVGSTAPVAQVRAADLARPAPRPRDSRLDTAAFEARFGLHLDWRAGLPALVGAWP